MKITSSLFLIIFITSSMIGCNSGPSDTPDLGDVSGKLTYDDKPIPGARIIFTPVDTQTRSAEATTDENGDYKLIFNSTNTGTAVGKNRISLEMPDQFEGEDTSANDEESEEKSTANIPSEAFDYSGTIGEYDVKPGDNEFNIELLDY